MNTDRQLVTRVLSRDTQAFHLLIRQHERLVGHMIGRLIKNEAEREEICQDVFMKVYEKLGEFNFQSKLSTWIATIAYRQALNALRKQRMTYSDLPDEDRTPFVDPVNLSDQVEGRDMDDYVLQQIDALPPQYKTVITLYHVEEMSYADIAAITGMPEGTVKSYLFRARQQLKEKLQKHLGKTVNL